MSERVHGAIKLAPAPNDGACALDISAGDGTSTAMLADRGWRVVATERRTARRGWVAADLNDDLPFRDAAFELVVMLEVIEHLPNIPHALSEVARVLKPGGTAILTTPNRLNLASRVHYLFTGYYKGRRAPLPYRYRVEDGRNWHVMGLNDFHWMAHGYGLTMDRLGKSRRKFKSLIAAPILYPFIAGASWMLYRRGIKDPAQRALNRDLFRFMTSASLLLDENIIMRFRKRVAPDAASTRIAVSR